MSQADSIPTTDPSAAEMAEMFDGLPGRPALSEYATWLAAGNDPERAAECRAFERRRASLMRAIYGDNEAEAA